MGSSPTRHPPPASHSSSSPGSQCSRSAGSYFDEQLIGVVSTQDAGGGLALHRIDYIKDRYTDRYMNESLKAMREQVMAEMKYIPRGNYAQNMLRMIYWPLRMNSLGKKAKTVETKESILKKAIEETRKTYPDFSPKYDDHFFEDVHAN